MLLSPNTNSEHFCGGTDVTRRESGVVLLRCGSLTIILWEAEDVQTICGKDVHVCVYVYAGDEDLVKATFENEVLFDATLEEEGLLSVTLEEEAIKSSNVDNLYDILLSLLAKLAILRSSLLITTL